MKVLICVIIILLAITIILAILNLRRSKRKEENAKEQGAILRHTKNVLGRVATSKLVWTIIVLASLAMVFQQDIFEFTTKATSEDGRAAEQINQKREIVLTPGKHEIEMSTTEWTPKLAYLPGTRVTRWRDDPNASYLIETQNGTLAIGPGKPVPEDKKGEIIVWARLKYVGPGETGIMHFFAYNDS